MEIFLVGGAVRDELLGLPIDEYDYVVVGASPQQLLDEGFEPVGKDFPVFLHPKTHDEYALARTERKSGRGYKGFDCYAAPDVTLEQDLQRRDLTVNAIAKNKAGKLVDPYGGVEDLRRRVLRHVSPAFSEDPLRVLRAARFAARFHELGFKIADETLALMRQMAASGELNDLTAERVWQEVSRSLTGPRPDVFFNTLHATDALAPLLQINLPDELRWPSLQQLGVSHQAKLEEAYAVWLWDLQQQICAPDLPELHTRLRVPNDCRDLANNVAASSLQLDASVDAESILKILKKADAWRRPERFQQLLSVLQIVKVTDESILEILSQAYNMCAAVDVQDIIAQGYKGQAISEQLNVQRREAVRQLLEQRSG